MALIAGDLVREHGVLLRRVALAVAVGVAGAFLVYKALRHHQAHDTKLAKDEAAAEEADEVGANRVFIERGSSSESASEDEEDGHRRLGRAEGSSDDKDSAASEDEPNAQSGSVAAPAPEERKNVKHNDRLHSMSFDANDDEDEDEDEDDISFDPLAFTADDGDDDFEPDELERSSVFDQPHDDDDSNDQELAMAPWARLALAAQALREGSESSNETANDASAIFEQAAKLLLFAEENPLENTTSYQPETPPESHQADDSHSQ